MPRQQLKGRNLPIINISIMLKVMKTIRLKYLLGAVLPLVLLWGFSASAKDKPNPNDVAIQIQTKGISGARATMTAWIHTSPEATWQTLIDFNDQGKKYPRLERSFCLQAADAKDVKRQKLRNGFTVEKNYKKNRCDPHELRTEGKKWQLHLFQEFDYPFPLANRWIVAEVNLDETKKRQNRYHMSGRLLYGHQKIYEVDLFVKPHPKNKGETFFEMRVWIDPGGIIMDWMLKEATEYVAPKYMEVLEK